jgi:hypothetical protein
METEVLEVALPDATTTLAGQTREASVVNAAGDEETRRRAYEI